jgi:hypothetical protein
MPSRIKPTKAQRKLADQLRKSDQGRKLAVLGLRHDLVMREASIDAAHIAQAEENFTKWMLPRLELVTAVCNYLRKSWRVTTCFDEEYMWDGYWDGYDFEQEAAFAFMEGKSAEQLRALISGEPTVPQPLPEVGNALKN